MNCLQWHPVGNCLISGANDGIVKVWGREPPGSTLETHSSEYQDAIKVHHGPLPAGFKGAIPEATAPTYITTEGGPGGNKGFKERGGKGPPQQGEKKYGPGSWEARGNNKSWGGSRGTNQSAGFPVGPGPDRGNATSYGSATSKSSIVPPSDDNVADGTSGRRVRSRFA